MINTQYACLLGGCWWLEISREARKFVHRQFNNLVITPDVHLCWLTLVEIGARHDIHHAARSWPRQYKGAAILARHAIHVFGFVSDYVSGESDFINWITKPVVEWGGVGLATDRAMAECPEEGCSLQLDSTLSAGAAERVGSLCLGHWELGVCFLFGCLIGEARKSVFGKIHNLIRGEDVPHRYLVRLLQELICHDSQWSSLRRNAVHMGTANFAGASSHFVLGV